MLDPMANSDSIVENLTENMWEDADASDLNGLDELDAAIDAFNAANRSIHVYQPDYSTAILVSKRTEEATIHVSQPTEQEDRKKEGL